MTSDEWYKAGEKGTILDLPVFFNRSGTGPCLVCVHGFPTSSWDFSRIWSQLTSRFDVIAPDLIGLGRSSKSDHQITVSLQADVIEALLVQNGIDRAHLLAHDLGDTVAQELVARQMERTAKVEWLSCVFLNGGLFPESHHPRLIQKLLVSPLGDWILKLVSKKTFASNMKSIFSPSHPPDQEFIAESWNLITYNDGVKMLSRLLRYMSERIEHREKWVKPLEHNVIPFRLINGILDPVSGLDTVERYKELVPDGDVVILEDAGHYPHIEVPDAVLNAFFAFHARLPENRIYN